MAKKAHPADLADIEAVGTATHFNVHLRRSPTSKINHEAATLAEAVAFADQIKAKNPGRNVLVYAITPTGATVPVPQMMQTAARRGDFDIATTKPAAKQVAGQVAEQLAKTKKPAKAPAPAPRTGRLPKAPDFSAATHARYRKKLAEVVALAKAGNLKALKALVIPTYSSSPRAMARYRDAVVEILLDPSRPGEAAIIAGADLGAGYSAALAAANID